LGNSTIGYTATAGNGSPLFSTLTSGSSLTMLESFAYTQSTTTTLAFTGLDPTKNYDFVFAFYQEPTDRVQTFTIGSSSLVDSSSQGTSFVSGDNYVEFTNITSNGSGDLSMTMTTDTGSYSLLSGFQIAQVAPAEAPEPSTYALLGLGSLALLIISRRRRTA